MQHADDDAPPPPPPDTESPPPPPPPDTAPPEEEAPPPPPPDSHPSESVAPPPPVNPEFTDEEGQLLWSVMQVVNAELLESDPSYELSENDVKDIQAEVLGSVFTVMASADRNEMNDQDRAFIKGRVRRMARQRLPNAAAPKRRFARMDRVVCQIGGSRGWAAGSVQALDEEDPSDPTG